MVFPTKKIEDNCLLCPFVLKELLMILFKQLLQIILYF